MVAAAAVAACAHRQPRTRTVDRNTGDSTRVAPDRRTVDSAHVTVDRGQANPARAALFRDTAGSSFAPPDAREFDLRRPAQRDSLLVLLAAERRRWQANRPRDYRFLLRVGCFCPGLRGWHLIEVRDDQAPRAFDRAGRAVSLTDWDTFSIDGLFDNVRRSTDRNAIVRIAFDSRWHFPWYVSTSYLPGPDAWSIVEVRGFRPL